MKAPRRSRRPLFLLPALAAILSGSSARAAYAIYEGSGIYSPSFRGESGTTYFGWSYGTWDGNPPPEVGQPDPSPDILNGTPSINPAALSGTSFITQTGTADIVSGSNNIYSSIAGINSQGLQLYIPTDGTAGSEGFTTIIIQGLSMSGAMFGFGGPLDGFGFGTINGVAAEYVITINDAGLGQWWAKWELPGNQSSYTVDIVGAEGVPGGSILSVTDLQVDTLYSTTGFASDAAVVPEPSALLLSFAGAAMLLRRRRR
jgi:hypothetical protein